jgi:hypothetical protein
MKLIIPHPARSLETTKSLAGAQVANVIHKITSMINSNDDGQDLASMKVVVDNEAKCSNSVPVTTSLHCNLNIRIHISAKRCIECT